MSDMKNGMGENDVLQADRRKFLADAGLLAATVPPTMVLLLSTTMSSSAIAQSGAPKGNNGVGQTPIYDGQPPGDPPPNDLFPQSEGNPGNKGGPG